MPAVLEGALYWNNSTRAPVIYTGLTFEGFFVLDVDDLMATTFWQYKRLGA